MPISCTTEDLEAFAAALRGMSEGAREAANTYLLAVAAGVDPDPDTISELSACFRCVPEQKLKEMQAYLTCIAAGGVTPPPPVGGYENISGSGDPTSETPDAAGQIYKDDDTGNLWRANSTTLGDWTLELQNGQVKWLPHNIMMGEAFGFTFKSGIISPTEFTFDQSTITEPLAIQSSTATIIRFPNLISVDPDFWWGSDLSFDSWSALTTIEAPLLNKLGSGSFDCTSCSSLTALSLPSLVEVAEHMKFPGCSSLVTVSFPLFLPTNGKTINFSGCALNAASVNHILARCVANAGFVSGQVNTSGGTSAAPTGQGITDKNTLNARAPGLAITN